MILSFSKQQFLERIITRSKKHTIREDNANRWKVGCIIHFWRGSPRNVKNMPYHFGIANVVDVKRIVIENNDLGKRVIIQGYNVSKNRWKELTREQIHELAVNDGFDNTDEFWQFFDKDMTGKLIYWDNFIAIANNKK